MSRIVKLEAENVKRLRAVTIAPDGAVVTIRGDNGQGKTSVLDAIEYALAGEKSHPAEPIRRGAEKARVVVETDDGTVIERRWTAGGTRLEVRNRDGLKYSTPQKLLDGLVGKLSFDPLAFMREKPERQAEVLRQLVGVDVSLLDAKRKQTFDARTEVNRRAAAAKARLDAVPVVEAPEAPLSAADLHEEQDRRRAQHDENEGRRRELVAVKERYREVERRIATGRTEIARLEKALVDAKALLANDEKDLEAALQRGQKLKVEVEAIADPDLEEIPRRLREVEAVNERVRQKKARAAEAEQVRLAEEASARLTAEIEAIDAQKAEVLQQASFPVAGLGFGEGGVTFNELPLAQASAAEQLRVSMGMGLALNPKLPIVLIRDGSLLDSKSLALITRMAEEAKAQVWLEVVGKGGVGIVIEDGQVEGAGAPAEAAHG